MRMIGGSVPGWRALAAAGAVLGSVMSGCGDDGGGGGGGVEPPPTEPWEEHPCEMPIPAGLDGDDFRCGTLGAPVDWDAPDDGLLAVEVAVLAARGEATEPPLVFFGGGPGIPNLDNYLQVQAATVLAPINDARDVVFFDPRGSGRSRPLLPCQEIIDATVETFESPTRTQAAYRDAYIQAYADCRQRLERRGDIDFDELHSANMARDVVLMMDELGYDGAFDIYGLSYGGRLAQVMIRDQPDRVRSAILDSTVLVETSFADGWPANYERTLDVLFDACAASEACAADHPDLEAELYDVVAQLNAEPVEITIDRPNPLYITGDRLLVGLHGALYDAGNADVLLELLDQLGEGRTSLLTLFATQLLPTIDGRADGQYATVLCAEEVAFDTPESIAAAHAGVQEELVRSVGALNGEIFARMCDDDVWPVTPRPAIERAPVVSDVPTLVLAGDLDPATPPANGETVVDGLANGQLVSFPAFSHGVLRAQAPTGDDPVPCGQQVIVDFLADPAAPVDASCVDDLPPLFE